MKNDDAIDRALHMETYQMRRLEIQRLIDEAVQKPATPETGGTKAVGISDLLCRAKTPKEGDTFRKYTSLCVVKSVGDGQVWYDIIHGTDEPTHCRETIEEYVRLVDRTIENGATFEAA